MAETHVALLRGINVGGKHPVPMAELRGVFEGLGCEDVRTYIQSGNVVYRAAEPLAPRVAGAAAKALARRYGFEVPVVTRSAAELAAVAEANPFLDRGAGPKALHVVFLADRPDPASVAALDPDRSPPDEFVVRGREIYLYLPNGAARSKLTNDWFDRSLRTTSTARNLRTVGKLLEMAGATGG